MKDAFLLLATGLGCSLVAWLFFHYLGSDAPCALISIVLIGTVAENLRLRRELRKLREKL